MLSVRPTKTNLHAVRRVLKRLNRSLVCWSDMAAWISENDAYIYVEMDAGAREFYANEVIENVSSLNLTKRL